MAQRVGASVAEATGRSLKAFAAWKFLGHAHRRELIAQAVAAGFGLDDMAAAAKARRAEIERIASQAPALIGNIREEPSPASPSPSIDRRPQKARPPAAPERPPAVAVGSAYRRETDSAEMLEVAPHCYVNREVAIELGLVTRRRDAAA